MNKKKLYWQLPFLLILIIGSIYIIAQQRSAPYQKDEGFIFGTVYHITYQNDNNLKQNIEAELEKVNKTFSTFDSTSIISLINQNKPVKINDMFAEIFDLSEEISTETEGAFDITVAPLVNVWGFGFKSGQKPTKEKIDSLRLLVGYNKVKLYENGVKKKNPKIMLDCSAVAKGYGSDIVARYLREQGVKNFMVEIGGEIVTSGLSENRLPWKIGVTKPSDNKTDMNQEVETILNVTDKAMATSGNYRNFYYKGGKKYAHTIDPKTGYPVQHSLLSATVLAKNCATADAYATSFMVMGVEKAEALLEKHPELMAYFIYAGPKGELKTWYSPSMKDKIAQ
ncbi:MAG: FAD:protein FMN transferase [Prevotella bivia]|uniref:FAD:protein FMN transferase n=1 Tax=Prevotella bivia DNF00320 TaxID=1401068 RepID=A0A096CJR9_9BACT|nr:FAD:protein FMN transferase [Prevotella bivia]KGF22908.1 thiamine biosynthesis protein ApbE [Prevotella bivia DNF00188]KGF45584.1 thiamine biosynthesis protein ApbE [Prevotella bivia DNF00320]KXU58750.1 ApbE family protein [Prevotella bivia]MDU3908568.1 FAD:protein FMN transferase [Prevotella bivia]MDU6553563.1 FAD:protein FMN transferase [Prevotella bivia]